MSMQRPYDTGESDGIRFFIGEEVEHTPAFGMKTLFVVGREYHEKVIRMATDNGCHHIYLGANMSFDPGNWKAGDHVESSAWDQMIKGCIESGLLVTLDFDACHCEWVHECCYSEHNNFIPQISVKLPYIGLFNYNATLKIDDRDFNSTNPGVWCHQLHELQDRRVFTPWMKYTKDVPI